MKKLVIKEEVHIPEENLVLEEGDTIEIFPKRVIKEGEDKLEEAVLTYWNKYADVAFSEVLDSNLMIMDKVSMIMKKIEFALFKSIKMDDRKQFKFYKIMLGMIKKQLSSIESIGKIQ